LGEREILALAISLEAEDVRIYTNLAEALREGFPKLATILDSMRGEESARAHFS
jgi:rubrerythrin